MRRFCTITKLQPPPNLEIIYNQTMESGPLSRHTEIILAAICGALSTLIFLALSFYFVSVLLVGSYLIFHRSVKLH